MFTLKHNFIGSLGGKNVRCIPQFLLEHFCNGLLVFVCLGFSVFWLLALRLVELEVLYAHVITKILNYLDKNQEKKGKGRSNPEEGNRCLDGP